MKSLFFFIALSAFLVSCGGSSVETKTDSTTVDTIIVDSVGVGGSITARDSNTAHIPIK